MQLSVEERRLLLLAALLLPLRKLTYKVKNKQAAASSYIIRESIKWRTKDVDSTALLHVQVEELAAVLRELEGPGVTSCDTMTLCDTVTLWGGGWCSPGAQHCFSKVLCCHESC
jgi:hypothetical protein